MVLFKESIGLLEFRVVFQRYHHKILKIHDGHTWNYSYKKKQEARARGFLVLHRIYRHRVVGFRVLKASGFWI